MPLISCDVGTGFGEPGVSGFSCRGWIGLGKIHPGDIRVDLCSQKTLTGILFEIYNADILIMETDIKPLGARP